MSNYDLSGKSSSEDLYEAAEKREKVLIDYKRVEENILYDSAFDFDKTLLSANKKKDFDPIKEDTYAEIIDLDSKTKALVLARSGFLKDKDPMNTQENYLYKHQTQVAVYKILIHGNVNKSIKVRKLEKAFTISNDFKIKFHFSNKKMTIFALHSESREEWRFLLYRASKEEIPSPKVNAGDEENSEEDSKEAKLKQNGKKRKKERSTVAFQAITIKHNQLFSNHDFPHIFLNCFVFQKDNLVLVYNGCSCPSGLLMIKLPPLTESKKEFKIETTIQDSGLKGLSVVYRNDADSVQKFPFADPENALASPFLEGSLIYDDQYEILDLMLVSGKIFRVKFETSVKSLPKLEFVTSFKDAMKSELEVIEDEDDEALEDIEDRLYDFEGNYCEPEYFMMVASDKTQFLKFCYVDGHLEQILQIFKANKRCLYVWIFQNGKKGGKNLMEWMNPANYNELLELLEPLESR